MAVLRRLAWATAALAFGASAGAFAQQPQADRLILSNDRGNGVTIGAAEDLREDWPAADVSGEEIVAEFKRLCLDTRFDAAAHGQAALASDWGFQRREVLLPAAGKQAVFGFADYRSGSASTSLWSGENGEALKGRVYRARSPGVVTISRVRTKDLYAPQCNLSLAVRGLVDAAPLATALERSLGQPATKVVLKSGFADGKWQIAGPAGEARRVSFDVVDMKDAIQLVHLTMQILPAARP